MNLKEWLFAPYSSDLPTAYFSILSVDIKHE